jgi:hypothetical protein
MDVDHQAPPDITCAGIGENGTAFNDPAFADFADRGVRVAVAEQSRGNSSRWLLRLY